jgi:hypothetical protein
LVAAVEVDLAMEVVLQSGKLLVVEDLQFDFKVARMISSLQRVVAAEVTAAQAARVVVSQVQAVL